MSEADSRKPAIVTTASKRMPASNPSRESAEQVVTSLGSDIKSGLSNGEASSRLQRHGRNELTATKSVPAWRRFVAQFEDVLVILLLVATGISAALWAYERDTTVPYEAIAIFAVVLLNATMGYIQEMRAEAAVGALRAMSAADATVVRDGERRNIAAEEVVPGDIILIEEGDNIPADGRIVDSSALQTAEASLTGESLPVTKDTARIGEDVPLGDRHNMVFSGTAATYGHGVAVVTATGMDTELGRIAGLLRDTNDESTPLQRELDRTGKLLGLVVVVIAIVMIATIIAVEDIRGLGAILDVLILGVALAVAAVPEGLPAVVTAVLSIGVQRMARRNAIVRHLAAVEALGSATVIASDKTGTLTKNEMTVRVVVTASGRVMFEAPGTHQKARYEGMMAQRWTGSFERSSSERLRPPIGPTMPRFKNTTVGGRCRVTRLKEPCSSRHARPACGPRCWTRGCHASAKSRSHRNES